MLSVTATIKGCIPVRKEQQIHLYPTTEDKFWIRWRKLATFDVCGEFSVKTPKHEKLTVKCSSSIMACPFASLTGLLITKLLL